MLSTRLKEARIAKGLSQRQLCGEEITRNMLSQIESGKAKPSMQTLTYLAQRLEKPVSWFLDEDTVSTSDSQVITDARAHYDRGAFRECLALLEADSNTDGVFGRERWLLQALCLMALAAEALEQDRAVYARTLLEKAALAGQQTPYYTQELEQRRLLLLYRAQPTMAWELAGQLSNLDDMLLLCAQGHLERKEYEKAAAKLGAVSTPTEQYYYLKGLTSMGQGDHTAAIEAFHLAEQAYPAVYAHLEACYRELEDYKMAYHYACKQRK